MKRHTLFIYIAALLTMLGTALPLSAQNKSFTINRNDGASQKYSYSQGDRLVLSREDSQGKKHADFVEQQVYLGNDVHNIPLTSIESITFDTQATVDEGKTFTVQESGGKIEYDDITLDFPSGTFSSSTKVTVSEMEKGQMDGENELSKFYKVKLSDGIRKNFKSAIKMEKSSNEDQIMMMFVSQGWAPSLNAEGYAKKLGYVAYEDGAYYTEIPAMENPDNASDAEIFFGLVNHIDDDYSTGTRAYLEDTKPKRPFIVHPDSYKNKAKYISIYTDMQKYMVPAVLNKIAELGFVKSDNSTINYKMESKFINPWFIVQPDAYGYYSQSKLFGLAGHCIILNRDKIYPLNSSKDRSELTQTIMHETLHYFQSYYGGSYYSHSMATILEEATAVWSERFFVSEEYKKNNYGLVNKEQCLGSLDLFVASLNPEHEDVHKATGVKWGDRYQNTGYGAAALIEYLSKKLGNNIVVKFFEKRKNSSDPKNTIAIIEDVVKEVSKEKYGKELDIFSQVEYQKFIEELGCKKVYDGRLLYADFSHMIRERVRHGDIGKVSQTIYNDRPVYFTNYAYGYGALVEQLKVSGYYNEDFKKGLDNTVATIEQTTAGLKTWVYRCLDYDAKNGRYKSYELVGMTEKDKPLDISSTIVKTDDRYDAGGYVYYLVTIPEKFKSNDGVLSKIEAKVKKDENIENDPVMIKLLKEAMNFSININAKWNFAIWDNEHSQAFSGKSGDCQIGDYKNLMGPPTITVTNNGKTATVTAKGKEQSKGSNYISNEDKELTMTISKNIITSLTYKYNYYYVKHDDWWEEDDVHEIHISLSARDIPLKEMSEGMLGRCVFEGTSAQGCVIEEITESTTNQYWYSLLKDVSFQQDFTHENSTEKKHYNPIYSSVSGIQGWDYKINISFVSGGINFNGVR